MFEKPTEKEEPLYRISFTVKDEEYEITAQGLLNSSLLGFIEIEDFIWEESSVIIDPIREKTRAKFKDVDCIFVPMHAVLQISIIEPKNATKKKGGTKIPSKDGNNVMPFPKSTHNPLAASQATSTTVVSESDTAAVHSSREQQDK